MFIFLILKQNKTPYHLNEGEISSTMLKQFKLDVSFLDMTANGKKSNILSITQHYQLK